MAGILGQFCMRRIVSVKKVSRLSAIHLGNKSNNVAASTSAIISRLVRRLADAKPDSDLILKDLRVFTMKHSPTQNRA